MNGLPLLPTIIVDIAGSAANILFSFLSLWYAFRLTRLKPENFLWGCLFYVTLAITAFAVSRAVGHIAKELLFIVGRGELWQGIAPYSGGFNTLCMISVAAVMIFYHKGVQAYEAIEQEAAKLKQSKIRLTQTANELKELNLNLEDKVEERTAELSKSERKFRHLFTASKDMVFFSDSSHAILDMNASGSEMLGYTADELSRLTLRDIFRHEGDVRTYAVMLEKDGYIRDLESEFKKKDGTTIYVLISATALYDEQGNIIGSEGIAKDLTRLKTMMEQLVSSEKMASVGQMAAGIAHEINTPLGIILGYAQLMMDDFDKDSETYQNLEVIERQTKASRKIVADLLKYSRQSGSARETVDVNEIIEDAVAITEHSLNLSHIKVLLTLAPDLPPIVGDPEKLRQVVVNLINNAHHAMEGQGSGELHLATRFDRQTGKVIAEVRDSGHGIPEHIKARIFDPFFTTKPVGKGTGLGLSVSYGIIQEHGGTIEIESPVSGPAGTQLPGTLFRLALPEAEETAAIKE
ncbi:multi-sensor signal transduction histidine kinase [Desulfobulbus propionicus DSM 2032]|uniref:histidine kinase n=1 Tax=Desulfobulbus propionicus (strain ATCC 33891 / DSM 2032 / VKM B-1956 / 1pr3) TaxID=577650 RepID=A0A7U4DPN8_DESPD|nr:ATP-binding protein [Desulfobulbus propionicus]ADW18177.1 multi-sensor signal transduction histidine kinase [Desulfobulbus propionicus DSM 2032]